jgi:branched-chain amino acid transport system substrate-binding protein
MCKDVGEGAKGYNAVTMQHGAEPAFQGVQDILKKCTTRVRARVPRKKWAQVLYMRGVMIADAGG